jgi:hypothetical protein
MKSHTLKCSAFMGKMLQSERSLVQYLTLQFCATAVAGVCDEQIYIVGSNVQYVCK